MSIKNETTLPIFETPFCPLVFLANHKNLSQEDFQVQRIIGTGSFSTVKLVSLKPFPTPLFALKLISKSEVVRTQHAAQLTQEYRICKKLTHPFIVKFFRSFQDPLSVCLLFEFVNGGELFNLISRKHTFTESWARFYAAETLLALRHLHDLNILYRDLKSENILIAQNGHIKLVDFGFAKIVDQTRARTLCGTPEYMAPEMLLKGSPIYTQAVDYWALGILAYEMVTGSVYQRLAFCS